MTTLVVPSLDARPWPTLGPQVCDWIEERLVYGPGDLRGRPYVIEAEFRALIYRAYEVHPRSHRRLAGRRRFKRVAWQLRKGTAKTEKAAILAICEAHPEAPVRCDGFDSRGRPVGRGVRDPYIPMVAYTEEQTEELAFAALRVILEESAVADDFDIGLERVLVLDERGRAAGKVEALAGSPNARDGARTTFQHFDETHRFTLPTLRKVHQTMLANIPKRPLADPWSLETTTAFVPGEQSVAESTWEYAQAIAEGRVSDVQLCFFARWADESHDLDTPKGLRAAIKEASGPYAAWSDLDGIAGEWSRPDLDRPYYRRVWLGQIVRSTEGAFDAVRWAELARPDMIVADGALIVAGFDGARFRDSTALIVTDVEHGHQWVAGIWERPETAGDNWEIGEADVTAAVADLIDRYHVWRIYADPPYWESTIDAWAGRWGDDRVVRWWTHRQRPMAHALKAYETAQRTGDVSHDGDPTFARHVGNARRHMLRILDDEGRPLWTIRKDRADSPRKIDAAMAGCLSWEARGDALAAGAAKRRRSRVMHTR